MKTSTQADLNRIISTHAHYGHGRKVEYTDNLVVNVLNLITLVPPHILYDKNQQQHLKIDDPFLLINDAGTIARSAASVISGNKYTTFALARFAQQDQLSTEVLYKGKVWYNEGLSKYNLDCASALANTLNYAHDFAHEFDPGVWQYGPDIEKWVTFQNDQFVRILLSSRYWDAHPEALETLVARSPNMSNARADWMHRELEQRRHKQAEKQKGDAPCIDDTVVGRIVSNCRTTRTLAPMRAAIDQLEAASDIMTGTMLEKLGTAFGLLPSTFDSIRIMITPPSQAEPRTDTPATKPEKVTAIGALFSIFGKQAKSTRPIPVAIPAAARHRSAIEAVRQNLQAMKEAEDALYEIYNQGSQKAMALETFAQDIGTYLGHDTGHELASEDPFLHKMLETGAERLDRAAKCMRFTAAFSSGLAERTIPVGNALSRFLNGANVSMTVSLAQDVVSCDGYADKIETALGKMLEITHWVASEFSLNATLLGPDSEGKANDLLLNARALETSLGSLARASDQSPRLTLRAPHAAPALATGG